MGKNKIQSIDGGDLKLAMIGYCPYCESEMTNLYYEDPHYISYFCHTCNKIYILDK